jgi:tetratricopeptide (TPR) repeat protein
LKYGHLKTFFFLGCVLLMSASYAFGQSAREYFQKGLFSYSQGNFDEAIVDFTHAIDTDPSLGTAYNNRGVVYAREGSMDRAIADFTMAIADNAKDAEAYNNRGRAYTRLGNLPQALADFSKAIDINSIYTKAYKNRGDVYFQLKQYNKAWADLFKVEELGGTVDHEFYQALKKAEGNFQGQDNQRVPPIESHEAD